MPNLKLSLLQADSRNVNQCSPEVLEKLKRNIQRTQLCPPLIVRPNPQQSGEYILIDGHHRKIVLEQLGWEEAECQIWNVSDSEAQIALATLNRLRGTDDLRKRAELLESLTHALPDYDLSLILPETQTEIDDLVALLRLDEAALEEAIQLQINTEQAMMPVPFTFMVSQTEAQLIQQALNLYSGEKSQQFYLLCQKHLALIEPS